MTYQPQAGPAGPGPAEPSPRAAADVIADAAQVLHGNGNTTDSTIHAVERLNEVFRTSYRVVPTWREITLVDADGAVVRTREVNLSAINMRRVTHLTQVIDGPEPPTPAQVERAVDEAGEMAVRPTWLFAAAAGAGAALLAVIFGASHVHSVVMLFLAAALGGVVRRVLGRRCSLTTQVFAAALIGGLAGAASVHVGWTSNARLIAVCPAMVLVPGPQVLNGCMDIARRRHDLGLARLSDAALTVLAISAGVVGGLLLGGASLPVTAQFRAAPLWVDVAGAALVACCYPVYFSMPWRTIPWAFLAGGIGHAAHWLTINELGWNAAGASLANCLVVAVLLTPVCLREHIPFAGAGFAAVVALVPGVYFFRAGAGLVDLLDATTASPDLIATAEDLTTAGFIVLAMAIGLLVPYQVGRAVRARQTLS